MKNVAHWQPTKFVHTKHGLRASRNPGHVGIGSRFITDIVAQHYETAIRCHVKGRLLDLGCGHVPLYGVYRDLVRETICIDWNNTRHINAYLDYTGDLNKALPFANASFDSVIFTDVLEHLAEPLSAIREIARVLRPGGTLIAGVPFFYRVHEGPHDFYRYTEFALRRFCKLSGLSVLELTPYGGLPEILVDLTSKGLEFLPGVIASVLRPFHTATCVLCKTPAIRKLSWWTRESFPLGYVLVANRPLTFDE